MAFNHFNNDEVFINSARVSIRKEDGRWNNIPAYSAILASLTSAAPQMREAMVTPGGKFLCNLSNMVGLLVTGPGNARTFPLCIHKKSSSKLNTPIRNILASC